MIRLVVENFQIFYEEGVFYRWKPMEINSFFEKIYWVLFGIKWQTIPNLPSVKLLLQIVKEVWKSYNKNFLLWSHESFRYNEQLSEPQLYFCKAITPGKNYFKVALFTSSRSKAK